MNVEKLISSLIRLFFLAAFLLLALAVAEAVANAADYTILRGWKPSRLLEYAVVLLSFVMALLLRQIRDRVGSR